MLLKVGPYDTLLSVRPKVVLQKDQYIRLLDARTGAERVVVGPLTMVPEPWESSEDGTEDATFLNTETAVLVLDRKTGQQHLVTTEGVYIPGPYEKVLEVRRKIRVLPHEAVIVRNSASVMTVHSGSEGASAGGNAFFLEPYSQLIQMNWSVYVESGSRMEVAKTPVGKIDMRAQKMFFSYEVRTSDNVKLRLAGTIFWRVRDVPRMISMTSDPSGDVSQHARSALIQAVSKATLSTFMSDFNNITLEAFKTQASDGFYLDRGVELQSMELTRYDCVDAETAQVLQRIIQETTNRINQLQKAESENEVRSARLQADIALEKQRTELIQSRAENSRIEADMAGRATGAELAQSASTFIAGLNESLPDVAARVELYKLHETMKGRNTDTHNLASGKASLFLTPEDLNLKLNM